MGTTYRGPRDQLLREANTWTGRQTFSGGAEVNPAGGDPDDVVTNAGAQTLTNKTLTAPTVTDPTYDDTSRRASSGNTVRAGSVKRLISKVDLPDATATAVARITTGSAGSGDEGGVYVVFIKGTASTISNSNPQLSRAVVGIYAMWSRSKFWNDGTGSNSAVVEVQELPSNSYNAGQSTIDVVTITVVESTDYDMDIMVSIDSSGTATTQGQFTAEIEVVYSGFSTTNRPVITEQ